MVRNKTRSRVSEERWVTALQAADGGNLRELVRAALIATSVPQWVRDDLILNGLFEDESVISENDKRLLELVRVYHGSRRTGEKRADRISRIIKEVGGATTRPSLENFLDGKGRAYQRLAGLRKKLPLPVKR